MTPSLQRLAGKSAMVTGGASGVGRSTARRFAQEGASVVCLFDRETANLSEVVTEVEQAGGRAFTFVGDVTSVDDCQTAVDLVRSQAGRLDVLVSNVGADLTVPFLEMTLEEWGPGREHQSPRFVRPRPDRGPIDGGRRTWRCDPLHGVHLPRSAPPRRTRITAPRRRASSTWPRRWRSSSSGTGFESTPSAPARSTRRCRWRSSEVRRLCSSPREHWPLVPMGRLGHPDEIAAGFAYLASDDAAYVTGHNLVIDGGLTAQAYSIPEDLFAR